MCDYEGPVICYANYGPCIEPRCPICKRFVSTRKSTVWMNGFGEIKKFAGVLCKIHGEIQPNVVGWYGDYFEDVSYNPD